MTHESPAEALLRSLGISSPADIDIEAIAWAAGAKVRHGVLKSCEARIIGYEDRAIITVQRGGDLRRRRFSIAHELGHWEHHRGQSSICRASDIGNPTSRGSPIERQADRYAADLLMPAYLFRESLQDHRKPSIDVIDALATEYSTSRLATAIRCIDLAGWPCILVCHGPKGRRWFRRSTALSDKWFPRGELDAASSAMSVLFGETEKSRPTRIRADAWFNHRDAPYATVIEQSVKAFGGDVWTLVTVIDDKRQG